MENRFKPGDIVQHFKREMLSDEERAANKYLYEIVGVATHSETREPITTMAACTCARWRCSSARSTARSIPT